MGCYSSSWHPRSLIIILIDMMYGCIGVNSGRKTVEVFHVHKVHPTIYFTIFLLIWNSFMIMMTFKLRSNRYILHFQSVCMLIYPISQLVHCANIALRRTFWTTKLCKVISYLFFLQQGTLSIFWTGILVFLVDFHPTFLPSLPNCI